MTVHRVVWACGNSGTSGQGAVVSFVHPRQFAGANANHRPAWDLMIIDLGIPQLNNLKGRVQMI